jgi:hypothetical protein
MPQQTTRRLPESGLIWKLSALVSDGLETRVAVV